MYKVISKDYPNELWAGGFYSKDKAQKELMRDIFIGTCMKKTSIKN